MSTDLRARIVAANARDRIDPCSDLESDARELLPLVLEEMD